MTQNKARRTNKIDFLQLPWAQEAPGSNPGAPTKTSRVFSSTYLKRRSPQTPSVEFWQTGGLDPQVIYFPRVRHMTNLQKHEEAGVLYRRD
jgi:hypothetical protein